MDVGSLISTALRNLGANVRLQNCHVGSPTPTISDPKQFGVSLGIIQRNLRDAVCGCCDRQANNALWRTAVVRITHDEETKVYAARRLSAKGSRRR